jgi:hypothetical protein
VGPQPPTADCTYCCAGAAGGAHLLLEAIAGGGGGALGPRTAADTQGGGGRRGYSCNLRLPIAILPGGHIRSDGDKNQNSLKIINERALDHIQ